MNLGSVTTTWGPLLQTFRIYIELGAAPCICNPAVGWRDDRRTSAYNRQVAWLLHSGKQRRGPRTGTGPPHFCYGTWMLHTQAHTQIHTIYIYYPPAPQREREERERKEGEKDLKNLFRVLVSIYTSKIQQGIPPSMTILLICPFLNEHHAKKDKCLEKPP